MRILCVGLPFRDWTWGDFKDFCAGAEFLIPGFISRREKVMGRNLYKIVKDNPRSLTLSYNGALHFSKTLGVRPGDTTLDRELEGYGINYKLAGKLDQGKRDFMIEKNRRRKEIPREG